MTAGVALELEAVSKSYPGVRAMAGVSLTCTAGEVHALVGENGAGKSTLIKVACGAIRPDEGRVFIGEEQLRRPSPLAARRLGLLTAYQDTSLVPGMTVAENLWLSFHGVRRLGVRTRLKQMGKLLEPFDLPFGPETPIADLGPGSKQLLEVVRAMIHRPKVLLLDEPTAALDATNIARLEDMIASAVDDGTAVLYITHRLDEVQRIAHRLTVIRDGRIEGTFGRQAWNVDDIVALMVGVRTDLAFPPKPGVEPNAPVTLKAQRFFGAGFGPVDISIRRGEVVGLAGAEGNGQHELVRALIGMHTGHGTVIANEREVRLTSPVVARQAGIIFQSGDRAAESIFAELSVMDNATVASHGLGRFGFVSRARQKAMYGQLATDLGIVAASPDQPARQLSGGNQQKLVVGRSMLEPESVLVVDEPTQGVDANARLDIYRALRAQADSGLALLVCSSDASELAGLCDRVYVMSRGRIVDELVDDVVEEPNIVSSFVSVGEGNGADGSPDTVASEERRSTRSVRQTLLGSSWTPVAAIVLLMLALGLYTSTQSPTFLTSGNIASLLIVALPLIVVALGEQVALISGGFDISVGATMSLGVVLASFWVTASTFVGSVPGAVLCLAVGALVGALNALVIRGLGVSPIIATIGTLGVVQGVGILLRPDPAGEIGSGITTALTDVVGFVPYAFIAVLLVAVLCEVGLRTTSAGLSLRAAGLSEDAARRTGIRVGAIKVGAYVACAVAAVTAGLFLAAQVGIGQNSVASSYALPAFTACFLGGAALTGGRGSFIGALLGAVFLTLLTNITPLLAWPDPTATTVTGALTILAVLAYSFTGGASQVSIKWRRAPTPDLDAHASTSDDAFSLASNSAGSER